MYSLASEIHGNSVCPVVRKCKSSLSESETKRLQMVLTVGWIAESKKEFATFVSIRKKSWKNCAGIKPIRTTKYAITW